MLNLRHIKFFFKEIHPIRKKCTSQTYVLEKKTIKICSQPYVLVDSWIWDIKRQLISTMDDCTRTYLGMSQHTNNRRIFLHLLQLHMNFLLSFFTFIFLRVLRKSFLFALAPTFVESPPHFFTQVLSPYCVKRTKSTWSFHISDNSNNNHWWSFYDSHSLTGLFLVKLCNESDSIRTSKFEKRHCGVEYKRSPISI